MQKFITNFQETGICEVNVFKVVKNWSNKFSISQWDEKFTLVKQGKGERCSKVQISKEQAKEIIEKANLLPIKSTLFRSGTTYRSKSNIISEINRITQICDEKTEEIEILKQIIEEYRTSLG